MFLGGFWASPRCALIYMPEHGTGMARPRGKPKRNQSAKTPRQEWPFSGERPQARRPRRGGPARRKAPKRAKPHKRRALFRRAANTCQQTASEGAWPGLLNTSAIFQEWNFFRCQNIASEGATRQMRTQVLHDIKALRHHQLPDRVRAERVVLLKGVVVAHVHRQAAGKQFGGQHPC